MLELIYGVVCAVIGFIFCWMIGSLFLGIIVTAIWGTQTAVKWGVLPDVGPDGQKLPLDVDRR